MSLREDGLTPRCTLIVPVYNAGAALNGSLREIQAWLSARPESWELIVIDDGSCDGSDRIVDQFVAAYRGDRIRVIRFVANRGKGFAVRVGLDRASGSIAIFTDCDLSYPLSNVDRLLERLSMGADAAIASRVAPESRCVIRSSFFSHVFCRHVIGRVFNLICRIVALPVLRDTQAGLKGFRTAAVRPLLPNLRLDGFSFDVEMLRALRDSGSQIDEVPVSFRYDSQLSTIDFATDALRMARDLVRVRYRSMRGAYGKTAAPRRVIIHADDYGLAPGVNRAIQEGLCSGALQSASILTGGEHAKDALSWAAAHPEFDFGVHLNLTQGCPLSDPAGVSSLVDRSGHFRTLAPFFVRLIFGQIDLGEVSAEWRAQIAAVRAAGVRISHLDSHRHVHLVPWLFRGVAARLAVEEHVTLRAMDGPIGAGPPSLRALALALATRLSVGRRFRHLVAAHGSCVFFAERATLGELRASLSRARPGETVELVVHPGFPDEALAASGDSYRVGRQREHALLVSEDARSWMRLSGVSPRDFRAPA